MARNTPRPPPFRPFDKLPLELIQHIVGLVHEQDKVFKESKIGRADFRYAKKPHWDSGFDDEANRAYREQHREWLQGRKESQTAPLEGKWSCWLGRGVTALSMVDKRFWKLCFKSVFETVTVKQLVQPLPARLVRERPDVAAAMHHLDLSGGTPLDYSLIADIPLLHITHLTLDYRMTALVGGEDPETPSVVVEYYRDIARRATSVEAQTLAPDELVKLLDHLDLPALRELKITQSEQSDDLFSLQQENSELLKRFRQLTSLEALEVDDPGVDEGRHTRQSPYRIDNSWLHDLTLPSLRTLTLSAGQAPDSVLSLAPSIALNLRSLHIREHDDYGASVTIPSIPSLRHFSLHTHTEGYIDFPDDSALASLTVDSLCTRHAECYETLPAPHEFPSTLRLVTWRLLSQCPPVDQAKYRQNCAKAGVTFRLDWTPDTYDWGPELSSGGYEHSRDFHHGSPHSDAIYDTLRWAERTYRRAEAVDDRRTVHELVQALMRVRERQAIDLQ